MKAVNWAILAPGLIAHRMAEAMVKSKEKSKINLYAIGSRNIERSKEFAEKYGFEKAYGSYKELLSDPKVEAVYIANPHAFHYDSIMQCLEAGKHVLCEKPAVCNLGQLNKVIEKAKEKKLFFMEAMWTAFNPCIQKLKKKIYEEKKIGDIKHIESTFFIRIPFDPNHRLWAPSLAGGALLDLGIYCIYYSMLINNFEPIINHSSTVRMSNDIDAWNSVNLTFKNGVTTHFESSCDMASPSTTHDAVIYGTKGFISSKLFFLQQRAEIYAYKPEGNENELVEVVEEKFDVNGFEYELIEANECILKGKIESDVHSFQRSIDLCQVMDQLRNDWGFKYPFEN